MVFSLLSGLGLLAFLSVICGDMSMLVIVNDFDRWKVEGSPDARENAWCLGFR